MKLNLWMTCLAGALTLGTLSAEDASPADAQNQPKQIPYNLHDEADKTDIFAIPLDSSEEEQDEELNDLEKESKK